MDCWVTGRCAAKLISGQGLFDGSLIDLLSDVNSVNKSSPIKHYVYSESDETLYKLAAIQLMKSCSRSTVSGQGPVDMFPRNCANTCYDGSSSGLLVKTVYYNVSTCNDTIQEE